MRAVLVTTIGDYSARDATLEKRRWGNRNEGSARKENRIGMNKIYYFQGHYNTNG